MFYKPSELTLIPLKDLPTGSMAEMVGRSDIPLVVRLQDKDEKKSRILLLGGQYSFDVADWGGDDQLVRVVCSENEMQFDLGAPAEHGDHTRPGSIFLQRNGPSLTVKPTQNQWRGAHIGLNTWSEIDADRSPFIVYPEWRVGKLNHRNEFTSIFELKKPSQ